MVIQTAKIEKYEGSNIYFVGKEKPLFIPPDKIKVAMTNYPAGKVVTYKTKDKQRGTLEGMQDPTANEMKSYLQDQKAAEAAGKGSQEFQPASDIPRDPEAEKQRSAEALQRNLNEKLTETPARPACFKPALCPKGCDGTKDPCQFKPKVKLAQPPAETPIDAPGASGTTNPPKSTGSAPPAKPRPEQTHSTVPPKDEWTEERDEFCNLLTATGREGMPALLQHLVEKTDFFIAPSSTKYHDARDGGLLHHSVKVYRNLMELVNIYDLEIPEDGTSLAIIALLHDVCKIGIYKKERKSLPRRDEKTHELALDDYGKKIWDEQIVFTVDDQYPLGHGEKSVIMLQRFIQLTDTEIFAIRWHMMAYDDSRNSYAGNLAITNASDKYRIIPLFHMADLAASFLEIQPDQKINEVTKDA